MEGDLASRYLAYLASAKRPMLNLLLATVFSAAFSLIVRYAQGKRCNMWAVGAANYAVASLINLGLQAPSGDVRPEPQTLIIGVLGGLSYVTAYLVLFRVMATRGVAVSTAVSRMAVVIPVAASVLLWQERPSGIQLVGSLLALCSVPLLGINRHSDDDEPLPGRATLLLFFLFVLNGTNLLAVRAFEQTGIEGESRLFLALLFGTAAVVALASWWPHRQGTSIQDVLLGLVLGGSNAAANMALVAAVGELPAFIVFPFHSAVGLALSVVVARLAWQERTDRRETAGIGIALAAAVLINL